ncbi:MAG TPA: hypothetical protein DCM87_18140 [Planctomycetes bacterium]|nr:hypothetical protein [Planctomycetota bacterium]
MSFLACAGLVALRALAAGGPLPPLEVFSVPARAEGAPFVARVVGRSAAELRIEPVAGGDPVCVPPATATSIKADKEPLRGYLENYAQLLRCRWVTAPGKNRPTVGFQETAGGSDARATVLDSGGRWVEAPEGEEPMRWGPALSGLDVELILGPPPVEVQADGAAEVVVVEQTCGVCGGKGNVDCPECDTGKVRGPCPRCSGSGKERCTTCKGTKGSPCTFCRGTGSVRQYRLSGEQWYGPCERCGGRGRTTCGGCNGKGEHTCLGCKGSGKVWVPCAACKGTRRLPCPACKKAPVRAEEPARAKEPVAPRIDHARVVAVAAGIEAGEASAGLAERSAAVAEALAAFKDAAGLYRQCMQSKERPGFRKALGAARKARYDEIQQLYLRGVALQTDLANFARWAERQSVLLTREAVAAVSPDVVFARVRSARDALARGAGKPERLRDGSANLHAALEREWSAFCAQLDAEARARAYAGDVAAAIADIANVKVARADGGEGVLEVRVTAARAAAASAALESVGERVFPDFPEIDLIVAAGRDDLALSREDWDEAMRARAPAAADASEEKDAEEGAERGPQSGAAESPSSPKRFMLLLCGGAAASFLLLAVVLRGRRNDERDSDEG